MSTHSSTHCPQSIFHLSPPAFKLQLVDAVTGAPVQGPILWIPFCEALLLLCEQVGNISAELEAVEDESIALFWQPPLSPSPEVIRTYTANID